MRQAFTVPRIFIAGHTGLVGSALVRRLSREPVTLLTQTRAALDLEDAAAVRHFFQSVRPDYVYLAAARVGGILANQTFPVDFLRSNLLVALNVLEAAAATKVRKLLFLGSSCIYPRVAPQPIVESALLTGPLEPTNQAYALAKIAGIELCRSYNRQFGTNFISVMPTNLYGPGDNFDLQSSHVLPAMIRRFHEAKLSKAEAVVLWGTGTPRREFLHVDDLADACVHLMDVHNGDDIVNIGTGEDLTIAELAHLVAKVVGFSGRITFDSSRPDGTPRKQLDVTRLHNLGWRWSIPLQDGIASTYEWYLKHGNTTSVHATQRRVAGQLPLSVQQRSDPRVERLPLRGLRAK